MATLTMLLKVEDERQKNKHLVSRYRGLLTQQRLGHEFRQQAVEKFKLDKEDTE